MTEVTSLTTWMRIGSGEGQGTRGGGVDQGENCSQLSGCPLLSETQGVLPKGTWGWGS